MMGQEKGGDDDDDGDDRSGPHIKAFADRSAGDNRRASGGVLDPSWPKGLPRETPERSELITEKKVIT